MMIDHLDASAKRATRRFRLEAPTSRESADEGTLNPAPAPALWKAELSGATWQTGSTLFLSPRSENGKWPVNGQRLGIRQGTARRPGRPH
jgi:hypothetical protein